MINKLLCLLLLLTTAVSAQERQLLEGRVMIGGDRAGTGLYVINNKTGEEARTDSRGNFSIRARPGDGLAVYSDKTETREFAVSDKSFKETPYELSVEYKSYELEEVEINKYKDIDSESLGLVPKGQKRYTPVERKLRTAGDFRPIHLLGLLAGALQVDPIINAINGKTKMLKAAVAAERNEALAEKAANLYTDEQIVNQFDIPQEYIKGFIFYIIEDKEFANALQAGNNERAKFLMAGLALNFLTTIKDE